MDREDRRHQAKGFRGTAENAKTRICQRWENGECRFGDRCNFAHGDDELRQLPPREGGAMPGRGRGRGHYRDDHGYGGRGRGRGRGGDGYYDHRGHQAHGMHQAHSQEHAAWVASGCPVAGLNGWTQYSTPQGEKYYHNSNTDETQWDAPSDWAEPGLPQC